MQGFKSRFFFHPKYKLNTNSYDAFADKYHLELLKENCKYCFMPKLNLDNSSDALEFAVQLKFNDLIRCITEYCSLLNNLLNNNY